MVETWVGDVIAFWFEELDAKQRFTKDEAIDQAIRTRFVTIHEDLVASFSVEDALESPERALASIIVLDQFSRNMFRGSARSFASDSLALALAKAAVARGLDRQIEAAKRLFMYLPFEHSEALADQDCAVTLIAGLGDPEFDRFAIAHRDVIKRFGRFPHRNAVLGRSSTPEEIAYLAEPGAGF